MTDLAEGAHPGRARFPALDPEPPRRLWSRRMGVRMGAVLVAAAAVGLVLALAGGSSRHRAGGEGALLTGVSGRIVAQTANGGIEETDPGGGQVVALTALGLHSQNGQRGLPGAVSPDGRYVAMSDGVVFSVRPGGLAIYATRLQLTGSQFTPAVYPFADADRYLVVQQSPNGPDTTSGGLSVVSLATGASVDLGTADSAAGDPQAPGAFVSVAAGGSTPTGSEGADSRIELRDAGRPPVVLATAASLNGDLAQEPLTPVQLIPYPDPQGNAVAIMVLPVGGASSAGLVVVTRSGHTLGTLDSGPAGGVVWSPRGFQLAFLTVTSGSVELATWSPAGVVQTRPFANPGDQPGWCLWSPDGTAVLCSTFSPVNGAPTGWEIAPPGGGLMVPVAIQGKPFAWLPGPAAAPSRS